MTEGVVASWLKQVGDPVKSGELIAEIETDKATMEFESFFDGVLLHIGVEAGKGAPVNALLAIIGQAGEDISSLLNSAPPVATQAPAKEETPAVAAPVTPAPAPAPAPAPVVPAPAPVAPVMAAQATQISNDRVYASPLAKKLADEKGIDLTYIAGSGENGRIVKRDVEHYHPHPNGQASAPVHRSGLTTETFTDEPVITDCP